MKPIKAKKQTSATRKGRNMIRGSKWQLIDQHDKLFRGTLLYTIHHGTARFVTFSVPKR